MKTLRNAIITLVIAMTGLMAIGTAHADQWGRDGWGRDRDRGWGNRGYYDCHPKRMCWRHCDFRGCWSHCEWRRHCEWHHRH